MNKLLGNLTSKKCLPICSLHATATRKGYEDLL